MPKMTRDTHNVNACTLYNVLTVILKHYQSLHIYTRHYTSLKFSKYLILPHSFNILNKDCHFEKSLVPPT